MLNICIILNSENPNGNERYNVIYIVIIQWNLLTGKSYE